MPRPTRTALLAGGALVALVVVGYGASYALSGDRIPRGVKVGAVDLSGDTRAQATRTLKEGKRLLLRAVAVSRRHFDTEERIVFPLAEKVLSPRTLLELGKRWEAQHKDLA